MPIEQEAEWAPEPFWIICELLSFYRFLKWLLYFSSDGVKTGSEISITSNFPKVSGFANHGF